MTSTTAPILIKKDEVCKRLDLSARSLEGMVRLGTFPPPVRMGKFVYWSETAIANWMGRMFGPQNAWKPG
jgi:prophage regulatory protein